jgi:hypothetical protein
MSFFMVFLDFSTLLLESKCLLNIWLVRNFKFRVFKIRFSIKAHLPYPVVYRKIVPFAIIVMHVLHVTSHCGNTPEKPAVCDFQSTRFVHNTNNKFHALLHSKILPTLFISAFLCQALSSTPRF